MVLLNLSAKLTKDLKLAPGGEFRNAFNEVSLVLNWPNLTHNIEQGHENPQLFGDSR